LMAFEKVKEQERKLQVSLLKFDYGKICIDEQEISKGLSQIQAEASALEQKINDAEHRRTELRKILQEKEDIRKVLQKDIDNLKEQIIINEERLKANLDKQNLFKSEQTKLQSEFAFAEESETVRNAINSKKTYLDQISKLYNTKEREFEELRHKNKELEAEIFTNQLALDELSEKDKQLFIRFSQITSDLSATETKLESLKQYKQNLDDSLSALNAAKSSQKLLKENRVEISRSLGDNYLGFLNEIIVAKPGFELALESVLFGIYDAVLIDSFNNITLEKIAREKPVVLIAKDSKKQSKPPPSSVNIGKPFRDVLEIKGDLPDAVKSIIDDYLLVDDFSEMQTSKKNSPQYSYVTKSGLSLTKTGILIIPKLSEDQQKSPTSSKDNIDEKIRVLSQEKTIIENRQKQLEENLQILIQDKQDKENERQETSGALHSKQEQLAQKHKQNKDNLDLASNLLFDLNKRREEINQIKSELDNITRSTSRRDEISAERNRIKDTIDNLVLEENNLKNAINNLRSKHQEQISHFNATEIGMLSTEYDELESKVNEYRIHLDIQKNDISNQQMKKFEANNNRERIEKQVSELLPNGLDLLRSTEPTIINIEDIKKELSSTQKKIIAIGLINPLAKDDYEREKTALDKLTNQRTDIQTAQNNLNFALYELTKKAEEMFLVTYKAVQVSFRRIFKEIFLEGEADLLLENPNTPLASDIKIIAQPRGKVPKRLDQLSDGEKALLALSLLFAFYDIKPAPFCFMDEVDAPLDDANVKRFTQFLKHISQTTQIIIITHNKLTVEAAAVVIGVTTQEVGISKIVSVRFKDIPAFAKV